MWYFDINFDYFMALWHLSVEFSSHSVRQLQLTKCAAAAAAASLLLCLPHLLLDLLWLASIATADFSRLQSGVCCLLQTPLAAWGLVWNYHSNSSCLLGLSFAPSPSPPTSSPLSPLRAGRLPSYN